MVKSRHSSQLKNLEGKPVRFYKRTSTFHLFYLAFVSSA